MNKIKALNPTLPIVMSIRTTGISPIYHVIAKVTTHCTGLERRMFMLDTDHLSDERISGDSRTERGLSQERLASTHDADAAIFHGLVEGGTAEYLQ